MATEPRPFEQMLDTGLLWLINTTVLHPRGYALALHFDGEGKATGWSVLGDGTEPWDFLANKIKMPDGKVIEHPDGMDLDAKFAAVEALLREARGG